MNTDGVVCKLTRRIFVEFVLPAMLMTGVWRAGRRDKEWYKNLYADILISRTIRHVIQVQDAKVSIFPDSQLGRQFRFPENVRLVQEMEKPAGSKDM